MKIKINGLDIEGDSSDLRKLLFEKSKIEIPKQSIEAKSIFRNKKRITAAALGKFLPPNEDVKKAQQKLEEAVNKFGIPRVSRITGILANTIQSRMLHNRNTGMRRGLYNLITQAQL